MYAAEDVTVDVLGPVVLRVSGDVLELRAPKERALLSALALTPGRAVSPTDLASALWDDVLPSTWRKSVQVHVSRLRRHLTSIGVPEGVIDTQGDAYVLQIPPCNVDVVRFDAKLHEGREWMARAMYERAVEAFFTALALWRGRPLPDLDGRVRWTGTCTRLAEQRASALEGEIEADLANGRAEAVVALIEEALASDPLRERLWSLLMVALYRTGRQADALRAFQRARSALVDELGLDPGAELVRIEAMVISQDPGLDLDTALTQGARRRSDTLRLGPGRMAVPGKTPVLFGRDEQLKTLVEIRKTVAEEGFKLILVSGADGSGKSQLAMRFEADLRAQGEEVLRVWCEPGGGSPFLPVRQAVDQGLDMYHRLRHSRWESPEVSVLAQLNPHLARRLGFPGPTLPIDPYAAAQAVKCLLSSDDMPVVSMFMDDLHWLDESTVVLLRHLIAQPEGVHLQMVATHRKRDTLARSDLDDLITDACMTGTLTEVVLEPLDHAASHQLVAAVLGPSDGDKDHRAREALIAYTGRNARLLESGALEWKRAGASPHDLQFWPPAAIRSMLGRTCRALDEGDYDVIGGAAVLGTEFAVEDLGTLLHRGGDEVVRALIRSEDRGLVEHRPEDPTQYRFSSAMTRDAILADLNPGIRSRLQARLHTDVITLDRSSGCRRSGSTLP